MRIKVVRNTSEAHNWFAWHPVVAEQATPTGVVYRLVWLESVQRVFMRVQGIVQWKYVITQQKL